MSKADSTWTDVNNAVTLSEMMYVVYSMKCWVLVMCKFSDQGFVDPS